MAVGTGGTPHPILPTPKLKSLKITTYKSVHSKRLKLAHSSVKIGNRRITCVQNCILLKCMFDTHTKHPPPQSPIRSYGLEAYNDNV